VHSNVSNIKKAKYQAAKTLHKDGGEGVQHREHKPRLQVIALPLYRPLKSLISPEFSSFLNVKQKTSISVSFAKKQCGMPPPPPHLSSGSSAQNLHI
jgi:hypothetical protein